MRLTPTVLVIAGAFAVIAALYLGAAALHSAQGVTSAIRSNARDLSSISDEESARLWPHVADMSREERELWLRGDFAEPLHEDMTKYVA
jgi:hypothetical protein